MPRFSSSMLSWKLHDEQLPQSAMARSAPLYLAATSSSRSLGAGWLALFLDRNSMFSTDRSALSLARMPSRSSRALGLELDTRAMASDFQSTGFNATFSAEVADRPNVGLTIRMPVSPQLLAKADTIACAARRPSVIASVSDCRAPARTSPAAKAEATEVRPPSSTTICPETSRASESGRNSAAGDWLR